jgi:transposase
VQVVDRWHLLKNLGDTVQDVLEHFRSWLFKSITVQETSAISTPSTRNTKTEQQRLDNISRRRALYDEIMALARQGLKQSLIADRMGVSRRTVQRFVAAPAFPERKRRRSDMGIIEPFIAEVIQCFEADCHNAFEIHRRLTALGYTGSYGTVNNTVKRLRQGLPARKPPRPAAPQHSQRYAPRQAKWLFTLRPEKLKQEEVADLKLMLAHPELSQLYELTQRCEIIVREQQVQAFDQWLLQAEASTFPAFHRFANGLRQDYAEVKAALMLPWSNGQVEGQVNRLKLMKRIMYGRANFDLLRQRVLQRV